HLAGDAATNASAGREFAVTQQAELGQTHADTSRVGSDAAEVWNCLRHVITLALAALTIERVPNLLGPSLTRAKSRVPALLIARLLAALGARVARFARRRRLTAIDDDSARFAERRKDRPAVSMVRIVPPLDHRSADPLMHADRVRDGE